MIIEIFTAARYVEILPDGLITIVSAGLNNSSAAKYPCNFPIHVIASIKFEPAEMGQHEFRINCVDEDGKSCFDIKQEVNAFVAEGRDPRGGFRQNVHIQGVGFPKPGRYSIDLLVDKQIVQSIGFHAQLKTPDTEAA